MRSMTTRSFTHSSTSEGILGMRSIGGISNAVYLTVPSVNEHDRNKQTKKEEESKEYLDYPSAPLIRLKFFTWPLPLASSRTRMTIGWLWTPFWRLALHNAKTQRTYTRARHTDACMHTRTHSNGTLIIRCAISGDVLQYFKVCVYDRASV